MSRPADEGMIGRNVAGKFLVETFLGGGAMGAVYKAYQKSIEKHVAIKVLHREFVMDSNFVSRFEREAKAASLLDHTNLMRVMDYGREPDGVCYIAMELLTGRSLFQLLKEDGRLADARIAGLTGQTLAGLAVAHEQGIIHRDLKPENIIVLERCDDDGQRVELVKVCDFGMAKMVTPESDAGGPLSSEKLTSHGVVVGTPDYMSPEQGKGERLDARSDLYAVGVILYQMLTGRLPFTADTPIATLLRHVVDAPVPPSDIEPDVHAGLEAVCLRALSKRREERFQSAREMRAEIRRVMEGGPPMASGAPPQRSPFGSVPEVDLAAFDLRPPRLPQSLDLPPQRAVMTTPPASHRIKALEALRDEDRVGRKWTTPVVAVLLAAAVFGVMTLRQRRMRSRVATAAPTAVPVLVAQPVASLATAEGMPAAAVAPSVPVGSSAPRAEMKGPLVSYSPPPPATLAVRGLKQEPSAQVPAPGGPAFGVLAVPEVPRIAANQHPPPRAAPPVSAAPISPVPAPAPSAGDAFARARVVVGRVHGEKLSPDDVLAALPRGRFDGCYKTGLARGGSAVAGQGTLHLTIDSVGHIGSASFAGSTDLAGVGQCIAEAVIGGDVRHIEVGATGADVDLAFRPE